jgi:hypothetical protein
MKNYHDYETCINSCLNCAALCNHCSSADAQEDNVNMMAKCIQLCMECATVCYACAQLMSLGSDKANEISALCVKMCNDCYAECSKHDHQHCKECAQACERCAEECKKIAA